MQNKQKNGSTKKTNSCRNLLVLLFACLLIAGLAFGQTRDQKKLELIVQTGHPVGISAIAFSPDGQIIATGGFNAAVKLWDVKTSKELRTLKGISRAITSVTFSPDSETLASVEARDGTLILWDVRTGIKKWEAQSGVIAVSFSHDGKLVISENGIWDTETGSVPKFLGNLELVQDQEDIGPIAISPDGRTLAIGNEAAGIKLWDLTTEKEVGLLKGHSGGILSLEFSPDGKGFASGGEDKIVILWDVGTNYREVNRLEMTEPVYSLIFSPKRKFLEISGQWWDIEKRRMPEFLGDQLDISNSAFSPDGNLLAVVGIDESITIWNVATGSQKWSFFQTSNTPNNKEYGVGFSPNGEYLIYRRGLWNVGTGRFAEFLGKKGDIESFDFSDDGNKLALYRFVDVPPGTFPSGASSKIELWDLATNKELRYLQAHSESIVSTSFSPDGKILASGDFAGKIRLWDFETTGELKILEGDPGYITAVAFSPDLETLASHQAAKTGYKVKIWNLETGINIRTFETEEGEGNLFFSPDGRFLVYGGDAWDLKTGKKPDFLEGKEGIRSIAFFRDSLLATLQDSADDGSGRVLTVWDIATGAQRRLDDPNEFISGPLVFSPNGKYIAAAGWGYPYFYLWDAESGRVLQIIEDDYDRLNASPPESLLFSPDNRFVAADRGDNHPVGLWDVATGEPIKYDKLPEWVHMSGSFAVTNINGKMIRAEQDGGQINLKDVNNKTLLAAVTALDESDWAVVAPDGLFDASNGAVDLMHYSYGLEIIGLEQLKKEYYDPGLLQKLLGFSKDVPRTIVPLKDVKLPPDVVEQTIEPDSNKLTIKLRSRGGGIGKTEVYVNNSLSIPDARTEELKADPFLPENETVTLTVDLTESKFINGKICEFQGGKEMCRSEDVIEVVTSNHLKEIGKSNVQSRGSKSVKTAKGGEKYTLPSLYALIAGVSDYGPNTGGDKKDPLDLSFAAKDAEVFSDALSLGARRLFCPKENLNCLDKVQIKTLSTIRQEREEQPTKENIKQAIAGIALEAKAEDIVVIYLSGHGVSFATGTDSYFYLTKEARSAGKEDLAKTFGDVAVSNNELADWLTQTEWKLGEKGIKALKQVLILDTCAAGNFTGKDGWKTDKDLSGDQVRAMEFLKGKTGTFILMGSSANKPSYEANRYGQGLLTRSLLEGIGGLALENEFVDVRSLFDYAEKRVPVLAEEVKIVQRPEIKQPSGNTFLIGQMKNADKQKIVLTMPKPMMLPPLLTDDESGADDEVRLIEQLGKLLGAEGSYTVVRQRGGKEPILVYVNSQSFPGAVRVTGRYKVEGENVRIVKAFLRKDGKTIATLAEEVVFKREEVADELLKLVLAKLVEIS